jgi:hypothetical protein
MGIKAFQPVFCGEILMPGPVDYEAVRRIWSAMIDCRLAAIACCIGPADVRAAVRFTVDQII